MVSVSDGRTHEFQRDPERPLDGVYKIFLRNMHERFALDPKEECKGKPKLRRRRQVRHEPLPGPGLHNDEQHWRSGPCALVGPRVLSVAGSSNAPSSGDVIRN